MPKLGVARPSAKFVNFLTKSVFKKKEGGFRLSLVYYLLERYAVACFVVNVGYSYILRCVEFVDASNEFFICASEGNGSNASCLVLVTSDVGVVKGLDVDCVSVVISHFFVLFLSFVWGFCSPPF